MRVVVTHERSDDYMYAGLEIVIDDTYKFSVHHSEDSPEDNTLDRSFADCFDIPSMLKRAYEAGKNGEELEIEYISEGNDGF